MTVRFLLYLATVEIFLFALQKFFLAVNWTGAASTLQPWLFSIGFICVVLVLFVALRWVRRKLMWRLRNRLVVTYVFIGVIPVVLLLALGTVATYLLGAQFATFLATSDIEHRLEALDTANLAFANSVARHLAQSSETPTLPNVPADERLPGWQITVWQRGRANVVATQEIDEKVKPFPQPPGSKDVHTIADLDGSRYLCSARKVRVGSQELIVVSSVPLDNSLLQKMTSDLGQVVLGNFVPAQPGRKERRTLSGGSLPGATNRFDVAIVFAAPVRITEWTTGDTSEEMLYVSTRPSLLARRLFANLGANAGAIVAVLIAISVLLGIIELLALVIGVRLTRTMTRSVYELYRATEHINRGDLAHRIDVRGQDQMAELETSFNSMTNSLQALIAEQKEKQRMESELAIAHEVQEQLFPRDVGRLSSIEIHGVCRPARSVSGDYYDFLPLGSEKLGVAVGDISGKGISAALLMATIHSAVRVYEMGRVPAREQLMAAGASAISLASETVSLMPSGVAQSPAAVLGLLNRHLFHSTPIEKYATMFFGLWDGHERVLTYSNAGHLPPMIVRQNGLIDELTVGGTVIGLFDDVVYQEAAVKLAPGDLLVVYSDGLTEPENEFGEFGTARLSDLLRKNRNLPLPRISEVVITSILDWIGAEEQPDDITLVLARAR